MGNVTGDVFSILKEADSIMIDSDAKVGKMTLASYLTKLLFAEKALVFTPQESYLLNKKMTTLTKQYKQFEDIDTYFTRYYLKEDWDTLKRQYGYTYLLTELERLIVNSDEKLIIFHRLGDFFEFQDRYEIEGFYKELVKIVTKCKKKIIFLINNQNQNYKYIQNVAQEFSDVTMSMYKNEKNERLVNVTNILTNQEYPPMEFTLHERSFILKYLDEVEDVDATRAKNVLIMELDTNLDKEHENMKNIYDYIFNRPEFNVYHANSFESILHHIFIKPDVIIVLMNRTEENLNTIKAIKGQLPDTVIISVIEQGFVRSEDVQEAYEYGCDELLPKTYLFDKFVLSLQKAIKLSFYANTLKVIKNESNILPSLASFKELVDVCLEHSIFFTFFVIEKNEAFDNLESSMRKLDYMYQSETKIYYLALNTMPYNIDIILEKHSPEYKEKQHLITLGTALDTKLMKECIG